MQARIRTLNPGCYRTCPVQSRTQTADATGTRPCHSAISIATSEDIPCVYPYANVHRLSQTDERHTRVVAHNPLHYYFSRRLDFYLYGRCKTHQWLEFPVIKLALGKTSLLLSRSPLRHIGYGARIKSAS